MNKEQQDKRWNSISEENREGHRQFYEVYKDYKIESYYYYVCRQMEEAFGTHNLNPKPQIKTWEDVEEYYTHIDIELDKATKSLSDYSHCSIQLLQKCIATLKIAKLIELSYGGMVSEEEIDNILPLWIIRCDYKGKVFVESFKGVVIDKLLTFRTRELAEEFMSHESNRQLVKQYYMM